MQHSSLLQPAKWSQWGTWSTCSVTCGKGRRTRRRTCSRSSDTVRCRGRPLEVQKCGNTQCPSAVYPIAYLTHHSLKKISAKLEWTVIYMCANCSVVSTCVSWGTPKWGVQPLHLWGTDTTRGSPECDWSSSVWSQCGCGRPAKGYPCPDRW